jgi:hypothetical protein
MAGTASTASYVASQVRNTYMKQEVKALFLRGHPRAIAPYWVIWYDWVIAISVACR